MSVEDREMPMDMQETLVKLEPREFCTETTTEEKLFKKKLTTSAISENPNGVSVNNPAVYGGNRPEVGSKITIKTEPGTEQNIVAESCHLQHQDVSAVVDADPTPVLNNDASELMDFCTNMRVDSNLSLLSGPGGLKDVSAALLSDSETSNVSDDTEYETAEQIAVTGATPVPNALAPPDNPAAVSHKPKTPGAKWARNNYSKPGVRKPLAMKPVVVPTEQIQKQFEKKWANNTTTAGEGGTQTVAVVTQSGEPNGGPAKKFLKILPRLPNMTASVATETPSSQASSSSPLDINNAVVVDTDSQQLMQFCTNISVSGGVSVTTTDTPAENPSTVTNTVQTPTPNNVINMTQQGGATTAVYSTANLSYPTTTTIVTKHNFSSFSRTPNRFQYNWMNVYHWLEYDMERQSMFCNMCKTLKKCNPFAQSRGCKNFKTCTLKRHEESKEHKEAMVHYGMTVMQPEGMAVAMATGSGGNAGPTNQIVGVDNKLVTNNSSLGSLAMRPTPSSLQNKQVAGVQYKIVPQTITTVNSGGAPVMIHKLISTQTRPKTGGAAAGKQSSSPDQGRNYNGFRMAYYIAKHQLPAKSADAIISLVSYPPFHGWKSTLRERIFGDMHKCIANAIRESVCSQLQRAHFLSLVLESWVDPGANASVEGSSSLRWLIVHAKYTHQNKPRAVFCRLERLSPEIDPEEVVTLLCNVLLGYGVPPGKVIGLEIAADKDGTLTHILSGVIRGMLQEGCDKLLTVHTSGSPQLSSAVSEVGPSIPAIRHYESIIGTLFSYFEDQASATTVKIPLLQEHLEQEQQCNGGVNVQSMAWLSRIGTVRVIYKVWPALVEALVTEEDEEAQDLLKAIKQYTFIALTYFLMDALSSIQFLDDVLRREPWNSAVVDSAAESSIASLEALQDNLGVHERRFFEQFDESSGRLATVLLLNHQKQQQEVADVRNEFLRVFLIELRGRFPEGFDSRTKCALRVLDPKVFTSVNANDSTPFGLPQITTIFSKLGLPVDKCGDEFQWVMDQARTRFSKAGVADFCRGLLATIDTPSYVTHMSKVIECMLILPGIHPAPDDRSSSAAGDALAAILKIESSSEGVVHDDRVANRLCIVLNGPVIDRFDYERAYLQWIDLHPEGVSNNELHWKLKMMRKKTPSSGVPGAQ